MPRWNVKVRDDNGRASVQLTEDGEVVGVITLPWSSYNSIVKRLVRLVLTTSFDSIKSVLDKRILEDALSLFPGAHDLAKKKLLELGWDQEKIDQYANELSRQLTQDLITHLPEHL